MGAADSPRDFGLQFLHDLRRIETDSLGFLGGDLVRVQRMPGAVSIRPARLGQGRRLVADAEDRGQDLG